MILRSLKDSISRFTLTHVAVVVFVLMQAWLLAQRSAAAYETRDASNKALLETHQKLDDELLKRESLQAANAPFTATRQRGCGAATDSSR